MIFLATGYVNGQATNHLKAISSGPEVYFVRPGELFLIVTDTNLLHLKVGPVISTRLYFHPGVPG